MIAPFSFFILAATAEAANPLPTLAEVKDVIKRVYQDALIVDTARPPSFVVGDFNWDGSPDIAVAARPAEGKLNEINSEVANWIVEDPRKVQMPDFASGVSRLSPSRALVEKRDTVLAVIHGNGPSGWRAPQTSHFYLLKNAVGTNMRSESRKEFFSATRDAPRRVLTVRGDVINEALSGERGFLLYSAGKYAWYTPHAHLCKEAGGGFHQKWAPPSRFGRVCQLSSRVFGATTTKRASVACAQGRPPRARTTDARFTR